MHIPDGFLTPPVWIAADAAALPAVAWLTRRAEREIDESRIPLLGVLGAFVFAAQMINFPVGMGTSGHLVGGALLGIVLGPAAAAVVLTAILAVQALVFQDGGVLALGANVLNMAIAGVWAAMLPYRYFAGTRWRPAGIFLAGVISVLVSAALALAQLRISGVPIPAPVFAASTVLFLISAILEGAITLAVVQAIEKIHVAAAPVSHRPAPAVGALLGAAILLVTGGVLFASGAPDGLESVAEQTGIAAQARNLWATPLADYELAGLSSEWARKAAAGLCGMALLFGACSLITRYLSRRNA